MHCALADLPQNKKELHTEFCTNSCGDAELLHSLQIGIFTLTENGR